MISEFIRRLLFIPPSCPETVQLAISNRCNFNCPMCQRFDLKVQLIDFDFEVFKKILPNLKGAKNLILTGWGEPLIHPNLIEMIKLGTQAGLKVRFTTNGNLLDEKLREKIIDSGLDAITFSVDQIENKSGSSGHPIAEQLNNIIALRQLIESKKSPLKIYLQTVITKDNHDDIMDVADFAIKNKITRLRLSRLDIRFHEFARPTFKEEKKLVKELLTKLKDTGVGLDFLPHIALDGLAQKVFSFISPLLHRGGRYCLRSYSDIYINENGKTTPCCGLPNLTYGDIKKNTLTEIWQNPAFKNFRKNQKTICGKCDVLKIKTFN